MKNPDLTVVVPVYNEEANNLRLLLERLERVLKPLLIFYEVIFVDDGSKERTNTALRELVAQHNYCKLIVMSRNFGELAAITAGLEHASGQVAVNMDSDLQDPPELIPTMLQYWRDGYDVVYTQQATRKESFIRQFVAMAFYRTLSASSSVDIPLDAGEFRLLSRRAIDAINAMPEKSRFLRGLVPWIGFKQIGIPFNRELRQEGTSQYALSKLIGLAIEGLLAFNVTPLYLVALLGITFFACGFLGLLLQSSLPGTIMQIPTATLMIVLLISGVQIVCVGVVAVYLVVLLREGRGRPVYIAAEKLGWEPPTPRTFNSSERSASRITEGY